MSNMEIWNALKRPPKDALRRIDAGRLKGKSDINPQWRLQAMTERFGPIGEGWGYDITKLWTEQAGDEVLAFATIELWYITDMGKSQKVPGIGGSKLLQKESSGLYANDEGYKMAVTDALSVALKQLGVAADIYAGKWDGSKYIDANDPEGSGISQMSTDDMYAELRAYADCIEDIDRQKKMIDWLSKSRNDKAALSRALAKKRGEENNAAG